MPQNYTRENILDHMRWFAYFGVAASQAMGSDFGDVPFRLRDELMAGTDPDAARFLTAGRGLAPLAEISAASQHHATYVVTIVEGTRADVEERRYARCRSSRCGSTRGVERSRPCPPISTAPFSTKRTRGGCAWLSTRPG